MNNCNWWEPFLLVACPRVDFQKLTDHSQDCVAAVGFFRSAPFVQLLWVSAGRESSRQEPIHGWLVTVAVIKSCMEVGSACSTSVGQELMGDAQAGNRNLELVVF